MTSLRDVDENSETSSTAIEFSASFRGVDTIAPGGEKVRVFLICDGAFVVLSFSPPRRFISLSR